MIAVAAVAVGGVLAVLTAAVTFIVSPHRRRLYHAMPDCRGHPFKRWRPDYCTSRPAHG